MQLHADAHISSLVRDPGVRENLFAVNVLITKIFFFEVIIKGRVPQAFEWLVLFKSEEREIYPAYPLPVSTLATPIAKLLTHFDRSDM